MNKDQGFFLLAGVLFGLVAGYVAAYQIHRPAPMSAPASTGPTHAPPSEGAAAEGGSAQGEALMQQVLQNIAELRGRLQQNPRDVDALVGLGNLYSDAGKYAEAIEFYTRALEIRPDDPDVLSDLGVAYRSTGDPRRAIEMFRKATRAHPDHWQSWLNIGIVSMFDLKDLRQAAEALERAAAINPAIPNLQALRDHLKHLEQGTPPSRS